MGIRTQMDNEDSTQDARGLTPEMVANKWKPGKSGNPAGRPIGLRNRSTIMREWLDMVVDGEPNLHRIMRALVNKASEGDVAAIKEALDSGFGKVADKTLHGEDADNPLTSLQRTIIDPKA